MQLLAETAQVTQLEAHFAATGVLDSKYPSMGTHFKLINCRKAAAVSHVLQSLALKHVRHEEGHG